jgi:1-acyl-sn-glycerol-3-phosphate acyltransferase
MRAGGMIAIDRSNGPEAIETLRRSAEIVAAGATVCAFAEGTRSRTGSIGPFKKGAFMLALQAQVPVVPVAIEGARKALLPDGFHVRPERVRVRVGKPIPTAGRTDADRDTLIAEARAEVIRMNLELGGLGALEAPPDPRLLSTGSAELIEPTSLERAGSSPRRPRRRMSAPM